MLYCSNKVKIKTVRAAKPINQYNIDDNLATMKDNKLWQQPWLSQQQEGKKKRRNKFQNR